MPAKSKAQFRFMKGICSGSIDPPKGLSRKEACEYVSGQSPKKLVARKSKKKLYKRKKEIGKGDAES